MVIATEGSFQGGGIGEVSGAKIAGALELALEDNKMERTIYPVIILDTGGVRLQESNYGLLAIAEIQSVISELRQYIPVVGVIPGKIGCFGGMSITAGLFSKLIVTKEARLTLNGPEVIEQEAGVNELDSKDKGRIWKTIGGIQRYRTGFADILTNDDADAVKKAVTDAFHTSSDVPRCMKIDEYLSMLSSFDPNSPVEPEALRNICKTTNPGKAALNKQQPLRERQTVGSRGEKWFALLSGSLENICKTSNSVLCADANFGEESVRIISVVPDPLNRFPRARSGEMGLEEGWTIAKLVREAVTADCGKKPRSIIAIVDVPSQAYGYREELLGLHQSLAAAVDAYAFARRNRHPVISLIVGNAISGGFLAHGLQGNRIVALDDPKVLVNAMSEKSAARITKRSVNEVESAAAVVPGVASDIHSFDSLGAVDRLLNGIHADGPGKDDSDMVVKILLEEISKVRNGTEDLRNRHESAKAQQGRLMSIKVRQELRRQWNI